MQQEREKPEEAGKLEDDSSFAKIAETFNKPKESGKKEGAWKMRCICKDEESEEYFVGFSNGEVVRYSLDVR